MNHFFPRGRIKRLRTINKCKKRPSDFIYCGQHEFAKTKTILVIPEHNEDNNFMLLHNGPFFWNFMISPLGINIYIGK